MTTDLLFSKRSYPAMVIFVIWRKTFCRWKDSGLELWFFLLSSLFNAILIANIETDGKIDNMLFDGGSISLLR